MHFGWLLFRVHSLEQFMRVLRAILFRFTIDANTVLFAWAYVPLLALVMVEQVFAARRARAGAMAPDRRNLERAVFAGALAAMLVVAFGFWRKHFYLARALEDGWAKIGAAATKRL